MEKEGIMKDLVVSNDDTFLNWKPRVNYSTILYPDNTRSVTILTSRISGVDKMIVDGRNLKVEEICLLKNAIDNAIVDKPASIELYLPYFPGAREDRTHRSEHKPEVRSFSSKAYAQQINSLGFDVVKVMDPHSDVIEALVNNVKIMKPDLMILQAIHQSVQEGGALDIVIPDLGARKKITSFMRRHNPTLISNTIQCLKHRDPNTGKLSGFEVLDDKVSPNALIVDDICDGGGTFLGIAEKLKEKGAKRLFLYTTHGLYTKGPNNLLKTFDKLFRSDSVHLPVQNWEYDTTNIETFKPRRNF